MSDSMKKTDFRVGSRLTITNEGKMMSKAIEDVLAERKRQQEVEGWTPEHDNEHQAGDIARAGATYAMCAAIAAGGDTSMLPVPYDWPWAPEWWKPTNSRRDLVKAAALLIAEIERLDRGGSCHG